MNNSNYNSNHFSRNKIIILSFFCSILVFYIHSYNLSKYNIDQDSYGFDRIVYVVENYWNGVTSIAIPMFFFISGFLFFRTFDINHLFNKLKSRCKTIILPYIIWCTIYYVYFLIGTNISSTQSLMNHNTVHLSFFEWLNWLWPDEYYTLWFLKNLIIFILLAPLIWVILKNHTRKIPTGLISLILSIIVIYFFSDITIYTVGLSEYIIGGYIGINIQSAFTYKNKWLSWGALLYIIFMVLTSFMYWNFFTEIIFIFAAWFFLDLFEIIEKLTLPWWMSITFFTYVSHDVLLEAFETIFYIIFGSAPIFALIDYIFMPIIVEIILICFAYILIKTTPFLWNLLSGGRGCIAKKS